MTRRRLARQLGGLGLSAALALTGCGSAEGSGETDTEGTGGSTGGPGTATSSSGPDGDDSDGSGGSDTGGPADDEVTIHRDAYGVPHIVAGSDAAALYGLGWASAQDRRLQMELSVRAAQGRLAASFGADQLEHDRRMRTFGLWRHAQAVAATLDDETLGLLQAYADGVNDWVAAHPDELNPVFADLGITPQPWTPAHSLATWYRAADLFTNDPLDKAAAYEAFEALVAQVGLDAAIAQTVETPHPGNPDAAVVQQSDVPADVQQAIADYATAMGYDEAAAAQTPPTYAHESPKFSHAWAVAGSRTTSGAPLLISDPQVPVMSPNFLYEWSIEGETIHARGVAPPGVPGLLIGYTPTVAWGMTAAGVDQRDLYALQMSDATTYTIDGTRYALIEETETIEVAGGAPVDITYRGSEWGPVVTRLLEGTSREYAMHGLPFSAPDRDPIVAMIAMMRATTLDELWLATEGWSTPSANLVAADDSGDVFYTIVGDIPLRSLASPLGGQIAQDGATTATAWLDNIPRQIRPWVRSPAAGYVYSANHRPVADWYPLPLGLGTGASGDTARSRRLGETLASLPATVGRDELVDTTQWDCVNSARRDIVRLGVQVEAMVPGRLSASSVAALDALQPWLQGGGSMHTEAPAVFLAAKIGTKFREEQTGPTINAQFGGGEGGLSLFLDTWMAQIAEDSDVVPDEDTAAYVDTVLADAWAAAMAQESDPDEWGSVFAATTASPSLPLFEGIEISDADLGPAYAPPVLQCVDGQTIWSQMGQTYTHVVDLAAVDDSATVLGPGNAEGPSHAHWDSQGQLWRDGGLKTAPLGAQAVAALATTSETLTYVPQG